jgi:hypothetical protein
MFPEDDAQPHAPWSAKWKIAAAVAVLAILVGLAAGYRFATARRTDVPRPFLVTQGWPGQIIGEATRLASGQGLPRRPPESALPPQVYPGGVQVGRSVLHLPAGECLLKHFGQAFVPLHDISHMRESDFAQFYFEENSEWYAGYPSQSSAAFNCCAFAVAPYVGLNSQDFLDGHAEDGFTNPMQVVLDSYFEHVRTYTLREALAEIAEDSRLQPGDVVCTMTTANGMLEVTHAARVLVHEGKNRLISKFGQGPVLLTDMSFALRTFPGDEVRVYRFRGPEEATVSTQ